MILTVGTACVIAALIVFARITPRHERPATADPTSATAEAPEPVVHPAATVEPAAANVLPLPAPGPPPAPVAVVKTPSQAEPDPALSEESGALAMLHDLAASDPQRSLKLAKEAVARFPDSPNAPEFEWNVVKALFNMDRLEEAKDEAQIMAQEYPGTYFTGDVEHHLLHPLPNPP
jgi:hypothetical protein